MSSQTKNLYSMLVLGAALFVISAVTVGLSTSGFTELAKPFARIPGSNQLAQLSGPGSGLIAYWNMDEGTASTTNDVSGNGKNGTLIGGATWTTGINGTGAVQFNGTNSRINMPINTNTLTAGFTIAFWAYPTSPAFAKYFFSASDGGSTRFYFREDAATQTLGGLSNWNPAIGSSVTANTWQHYVMTWDGTNTGKIYRNGAVIASSASIVQAFPNHVISVGADELLAANGFYSGKLDEFRVYNRALSAAEVSSLYAYQPTMSAQASFNITATTNGGACQSIGVSFSPGVASGVTYKLARASSGTPGSYAPLSGSTTIATWTNPSGATFAINDQTAVPSGVYYYQVVVNSSGVYTYTQTVSATSSASLCYTDLTLHNYQGTSSFPYIIGHAAATYAVAGEHNVVRLRKGGITYDAALTTVSNPDATKIHVALPNGTVRALLECRIGASTPSCQCLPDLQDFPKHNENQLFWSHIGSHHYNIYRGTTTGGPYSFIASTTSTFSTYDDNALTNGIAYFYLVRPANSSNIEQCESKEVMGVPY